MLIVRAIIVALAMAGCISAAGSPYDSDSLKAAYDSRTIEPVEGIWQWPDDGAVIAVTRRTADTFAVQVVDSPTLWLEPGTEIGVLTQSTRRGVYTASLLTKADDKGALSGSKKFVVEATGEGTLALKRYKTGLRLNFRRWIPYLFRVAVDERNDKAPGLDGPRRIYPPCEPGGAEQVTPKLL